MQACKRSLGNDEEGEGYQTLTEDVQELEHRWSPSPPRAKPLVK